MDNQKQPSDSDENRVIAHVGHVDPTDSSSPYRLPGDDIDNDRPVSLDEARKSRVAAEAHDLSDNLREEIRILEMQIAVNELLPPDLQCTDAIDGWKTRLRLLHQADAKLRHADALAAWARDRKPAHD